MACSTAVIVYVTEYAAVKAVATEAHARTRETVTYVSSRSLSLSAADMVPAKAITPKKKVIALITGMMNDMDV